MGVNIQRQSSHHPAENADIIANVPGKSYCKTGQSRSLCKSSLDSQGTFTVSLPVLDSKLFDRVRSTSRRIALGMFNPAEADLHPQTCRHSERRPGGTGQAVQPTQSCFRQ